MKSDIVIPRACVTRPAVENVANDTRRVVLSFFFLSLSRFLFLFFELDAAFREMNFKRAHRWTRERECRDIKTQPAECRLKFTGKRQHGLYRQLMVTQRDGGARLNSTREMAIYEISYTQLTYRASNLGNFIFIFTLTTIERIESTSSPESCHDPVRQCPR